MDWPEELIVGGTVKNRSRIIRRCVLFLDVMDNNYSTLWLEKTYSIKVMAHLSLNDGAY